MPGVDRAEQDACLKEQLSNPGKGERVTGRKTQTKDIGPTSHAQGRSRPVPPPHVLDHHCTALGGPCSTRPMTPTSLQYKSTHTEVILSLSHTFNKILMVIRLVKVLQQHLLWLHGVKQAG